MRRFKRMLGFMAVLTIPIVAALVGICTTAPPASASDFWVKKVINGNFDIGDIKTSGGGQLFVTPAIGASLTSTNDQTTGDAAQVAMASPSDVPLGLEKMMSDSTTIDGPFACAS